MSRRANGEEPPHGTVARYRWGRVTCTCQPCRDANAAAHRAYRRTRAGAECVRKMNLRKYGLTLDQYDAILRGANSRCEACGGEETGRNQFGRVSLAIDHDHATGQFRGLLCMRCNRSLGMLGDSAEQIDKLATYRRRFS